MIALLTSLGILLALGVIGAGLILSLWDAVDLLTLLGLAYPLGAGVFTALVFVMSLVSIPLTVASTIVLYALVTSVLAYHLARRSTSTLLSAVYRDLEWNRICLAIGIGVWFSLAVFISVGRSYSTYDALAGWALKGYGIFLEGTIYAAAKWGTWGLAYPLNMPLQIGLHWLFGAETLPGSKLIFPLFLLCTGLVAFGFLDWIGVRRRTAAIGSAFIVTNPLIFLHGTIGFQNLPFGYYLLSAILVSIRGFSTDNKNVILLGGVLLAVTAWTRAEGILFCAAGIVSIMVGFRRALRAPTTLLFWGMPLGVLSLIWFGFGWQGISDSHLGEAMRAVLPSILEGKFNFSKLIQVPSLFLERALSPENWGYFVPGLLILVLVGLVVNRMNWDPESLALAVGSMLISAVPMGLFYLRSFSRPSDFKALLIRSFDRAFIPAALLLSVAWLAIALREARRVSCT